MSIHFDKSCMEEVLENHERWWRGELERPLVVGSIVDAYAPSHTAKAPVLSQKTCNDFSWSPEAVIDTLDSKLSTYEFMGDGYPHVDMGAFGPGVLAAFCGAKLDNSSGRVWFFPEEKKELSEIHVKYDPENIYSRRIKDIYRAGLERWDGAVVMGMPDLGGVLDVLSHLYGSEDLLYALIDEPEEVQRLTGEIQKAWYEAYEDFAEVLKPQGIYSDWALLLSSTPSYILQCDFSYMISPDMFEEFVLETLREDTCRLSNTMYHMDGVGQLPHLDYILSLKDLKAVQWIFGEGKPGPIHWMDVYRKILDAGKLIQIDGNPFKEGGYLDVLAEVHGCPFTFFY